MLDDIADDVAISCREIVPRAQAEFRRLDEDEDGWVGPEEVGRLAQWTFLNYHPRGVALSVHQQRSAVRLLNTVIGIGDGRRLAIEQFCRWIQGL